MSSERRQPASRTAATVACIVWGVSKATAAGATASKISPACRKSHAWLVQKRAAESHRYRFPPSVPARRRTMSISQRQ